METVIDEKGGGGGFLGPNGAGKTTTLKMLTGKVNVLGFK